MFPSSRVAVHVKRKERSAGRACIRHSETEPTSVAPNRMHHVPSGEVAACRPTHTNTGIASSCETMQNAIVQAIEWS